MYAGAQMKRRGLPSIQPVGHGLAHRLNYFPNVFKESIMNKNQVKGALKDLAGKVQEEAGKLVGSREQQAKGLQKQVAGKAEERLGDAKEVVREARETVKAVTKP